MRRRLTRFGRWFLGLLDPITVYGLIVATALTAALGAIVTFDFIEAARVNRDLAWLYSLGGRYVPPLFLAAYVIHIVLSIGNVAIRKKTRKVYRAFEQAQERVGLVSENLRVLFNGLLAGTANKLGEPDPRARLSLYVHDGADRFTLCGRYSFNPDLKKTGRPFYPDSQGCIGTAWREGWHYRVMPHRNQDYDQACSQDYGIDLDTLQTISMRSRTFAAKRIDGRQGELAIVMYESLARPGVAEDQIQPILEDFAASYSELIESFRDYVPTPDVALERGF